MLKNIFRSFLFALYFLCLPSVAANEVPVMLCAYDMGDANIMKRVASALDKARIDYRIFAMGKAKTVFKDHPQVILTETDDEQNREKKLSATETNNLSSAYQPKTILCGMSSAAQAQVLNVFSRSRRYAIYDNFDDPIGKEFIQPFMATIQKVTAFLVPADFLKEPMTILARGRGDVITVGQPVLEDWIELFQTVDRASLMERLKVHPGQKVIVFAGGMDPDYPHYFQIFVDAVRDHKDWAVFVTYHPKSTGDVERDIVSKSGAIHIVVSNDVPTSHLASISDALVSHKSSVLQQAYTAGVERCIYVAENSYKNFLISSGSAQRFDTKDELEKYLLEGLEGKPSDLSAARNQSLAQKSGIPMDGTRRILTLLTNESK